MVGGAICAVIVGVANTLRVAVIGIVPAPPPGTLIGIARLCADWLPSRLAAAFVGLPRDIPLPPHLLFWYVLMRGLPPAWGAFCPLAGVFLANRGPTLPPVAVGCRQGLVLAAAALGLLTLLVPRRWRIATPDAGRRRAAHLTLGTAARVRSAGRVSWTVGTNELHGFNFTSGFLLAPEYFAVLIALVT